MHLALKVIGGFIVMSKPFENKLALVTGSSRGIGAAIAVRLAAEGAYVIVNYAASPDRAEQVVAEITKAGGHAEAVQADLSTVEGTKALVESVGKVFGGKFGGRVDILVKEESHSRWTQIHDTSRNQCYALSSRDQGEHGVHQIGLACDPRSKSCLLAHAKNRVIDGRGACPLKQNKGLFGQLIHPEFPSCKAMSRRDSNDEWLAKNGPYLEL
jgi:3-oxoacyl-ACP reductase-like protein